MRLVNYKISRPNGTQFFTTDSAEALKPENRVEETFLTEVDTRTDEMKAAMRRQAQKAKEFFKAKRG